MKEEKTKSFAISKRMVYDSYLKVCSKGGAAGVDKQSIENFNAKISKNLYKVWNRMASGSYFPPNVRRVEIPKKSGGTRPLGIPTVGDRIAQGVVKDWLEPILEPIFHESSYGYRPNRSTHNALKACDTNCQQNSWVIDVDIKGFFDNINHDWMMQMVKYHTKEKWVLLYVERWLRASVEQADGQIITREKGTPQGGVISPLLANLYLHHAFDLWMKKYHSNVPFERYADDIVIHCQSKEQAEALLNELHARIAKFMLSLHPEKTKIVYCYNDRRKSQAEENNRSFVFLSYSFQPRSFTKKAGDVIKRGVMFTAAICDAAKKHIREQIRKYFNPMWTNLSLEDFAKTLNPRVRGWMNYYCLYNRNLTNKVIAYINHLTQKWIGLKYKLTSIKATVRRYKCILKDQTQLFYHWTKGITYTHWIR